MQCRRPWFDSWVGKIHWKRDRLLTPVFLGFPGGSDGKESFCHVGDLGFNPWAGKIPWRRAWQHTPVFLPGESPWTEGPCGLHSMGSHRVGHDWLTKHIVILKYWLSSPCCTVYPCILFYTYLFVLLNPLPLYATSPSLLASLEWNFTISSNIILGDYYQSEINQTEKGKHYMISFICGI